MDDQQQVDEQDDERWFARPEMREWLRRYPTLYAEIWDDEALYAS